MINQAHLLKSKDTDYMNPEQLDYFKQLLDTEKQTIMSCIRNARSILVDNDLNPDPLDTAVQEEIKEITLQRVERDTLMLHKIEAALNRIHNNEYGYCELTGEPIGIPRLLAQPIAKLSIAAKTAKENKERIEGCI